MCQLLRACLAGSSCFMRMLAAQSLLQLLVDQHAEAAWQLPFPEDVSALNDLDQLLIHVTQGINWVLVPSRYMLSVASHYIEVWESYLIIKILRCVIAVAQILLL